MNECYRKGDHGQVIAIASLIDNGRTLSVPVQRLLSLRCSLLSLTLNPQRWILGRGESSSRNLRNILAGGGSCTSPRAGRNTAAS